MQDYSHLTEQQVRSLLQAVPKDRDRLCLLMSYLHGLRIGEAVGGLSETRGPDGTVTRKVYNPPLLVKHTAGGYLQIHRLKGSKDGVHVIVAHSDLVFNEAVLLETVVTTHGLKPEDRLFEHERSYYNRLIITAGTAVGLPRHICKPHALRHSIAMHTVKKVSIHELMRYMGHKSLNSTGQYLKVTDAEASQAINKALEEK